MNVNGKYIKDEDGNIISPVTSASTVFDKNNESIDSVISSFVRAEDVGEVGEILVNSVVSNYTDNEKDAYSTKYINERYNRVNLYRDYSTSTNTGIFMNSVITTVKSFDITVMIGGAAGNLIATSGRMPATDNVTFAINFARPYENKSLYTYAAYIRTNGNKLLFDGGAFYAVTLDASGNKTINYMESSYSNLAIVEVNGYMD